MSNDIFDEEYSFKSDSGSDNYSPVDCIKQIKSFVRLTGINTDEWVACAFEKTATKNEQGRIQYQFTGKDTEGYTDVTPFFDNIDERRKDR